MHRSFSHPSFRALNSFLERSSESKIDMKTIASLEKIIDDCKIRKRTAAASRWFGLTARAVELRFNHLVQVDTMFIHGRPVLHMLEKATHCCASSFLHGQITNEI